MPDQAAAAAAAGGLPTPTDAQPATPLAHIEQQIIHAGRYFVDYHDPDSPNYVTAWDSISGGGLLVAVEARALIAASSYSDFKTAVDQLEFAENGWTALTNFRDYQSNGHQEPPGIQTWDLFGHDRARFRLKLDAPAPEGGYKIPLRIGIVRSAPTGDPAYVEILLECAEGETVGTPVNFSPPSAPGSNESIVYIPLSVSTMLPSANGAWSPPADGTCVTSSEAFLLDCGNWDPTLLLDGNAAALEVFWKKRKLKGDGTFEEWMTIYDPGHFDPANPLMPLPLKGPSKTVSGMNGGIYQLKAVVVLPDSSIFEVPFVRMRDARSNVDSGGNQNALLIAGQPDYFGIYENLLSQSVRNAAIPWLGATGYNEDADVPIEPGANFFNASTKGKPKCNLFITHLSNSIGATTPYFNRKRFGIPTPQSSAPIAKHDWYQNPEVNIDIDPDGWNFLADATLPATNPTVKDFTTDLGSLRSWQGGPCPGMAVASPRTKAGTAFGHVGIMDYDGSWINAGSKKVTKCLHLLDVVNDYKPNTFRSR